MIGFVTGSVGLTLEAPTGAQAVDTPYGAPSAEIASHRIGDEEALVLARHGAAHEFAPHEINYRANVWALKEAGATALVACFTVGGIDPALAPGALVVPDQIVDYTWGRDMTYGGHANGVPVAHALFDEPFDAALRQSLLGASDELLDGGVYGCTQGPRLETAAEIVRMARDGCTLVGMTGMPEATLARELELPYAAVCLVVNPAAGVGAIVETEIREVARQGAARLADVFRRFLSA